MGRYRWVAGLTAVCAAVIGVAALVFSDKSVEREQAGTSATPRVAPSPTAAFATRAPRVNTEADVWFAQPKTLDFSATVRISGGGLPRPITVPVVDYKAATNVFVDTRNAWWSKENRPPPPSEAPRYTIEFVLASADLSVIKNPGWNDSVVSFVPGNPPLVGPTYWGWVQPNEYFADLLSRYVTLGLTGSLPSTPTLKQALEASDRILGTRIDFSDVYLNGGKADGRQLTGADASRFVALLSGSEIAMFGVRGNLIGQRGYTYVRTQVWFGGLRGPLINYVVPGSLAPYGFLFATRHLGAWRAPMVNMPSAYSQEAFSVTPEFDELMTALGYRDGPLQGIDEYRMVPQRPGEGDWRRIKRIEVLKEGGSAHLVLTPAAGLCDEGCEAKPATAPDSPNRSARCIVEITPVGAQPFPEAVQAPRYYYYPAAADSDAGILVQFTPLNVANAMYGISAPFYAPDVLGGVLRSACATVVS